MRQSGTVYNASILSPPHLLLVSPMVYILTAVAIIAIIGIALLIDFFDKNDIRSKEEKIRYQYTRKRFFLTRAEHEY